MGAQSSARYVSWEGTGGVLEPLSCQAPERDTAAVAPGAVLGMIEGKLQAKAVVGLRTRRG